VWTVGTVGAVGSAVGLLAAGRRHRRSSIVCCDMCHCPHMHTGVLGTGGAASQRSSSAAVAMCVSRCVWKRHCSASIDGGHWSAVPCVDPAIEAGEMAGSDLYEALG